jgi:RimJ/RimL family protein N-acetyltransferase
VLQRSLSDGVITIRPFAADDEAVLVAGRDEEFHRFLGDGDPHPHPVACIVADDVVVGWVDYDHERPWLDADEVNLGYNVFRDARGRGYATRAVRLLMRHLASDTEWRVASLLIDADNSRSLALARRAGFDAAGDLDGNPYWKQSVASFHEDTTAAP